MAKGRPKATRRRQECFDLYRRLGTLSAVAKETGIDPAQLSRWKKEGDWDTKVAHVRGQIRDMTQLKKLEEELNIARYDAEDEADLNMLKFFVTEGLKAYELGEIKFTRMSELHNFIKMFIEMKRIMSGKATSVTETVTQHKISFGDDMQSNIKILLGIAAGGDGGEVTRGVIEAELATDSNDR